MRTWQEGVARYSTVAGGGGGCVHARSIYHCLLVIFYVNCPEGNTSLLYKSAKNKSFAPCLLPPGTMCNEDIIEKFANGTRKA